MTLWSKDEPETEVERQLRSHLALIDYFARKAIEGTPDIDLAHLRGKALLAIRETAAPFIVPIKDEDVALIDDEYYFGIKNGGPQR